MKFNKINYKKLLSASLIAFQVTTLSGCISTPLEEVKAIEINIDETKKDNDDIVIVNEVEKSNLEIIYEETILVPLQSSEVTTEQSSNDFLALLDSIPTIENLNEYYMENFAELNNILDENAYQMQLSYAASAYKKLKNSNIDSKIILQELNNLIVEQQLPRGMDDEEWQDNFGNIITTLDPEQSLFDTYFTLAYMIHDHICEEEHTLNEFGGTNCKTLVKEFKDKYFITNEKINSY